MSGCVDEYVGDAVARESCCCVVSSVLRMEEMSGCERDCVEGCVSCLSCCSDTCPTPKTGGFRGDGMSDNTRNY